MCLLLAPLLCLTTCAAVTSHEYFAVHRGHDRTDHSEEGDVNIVYRGLKPDVAVVERGDLQFRLNVEGRSEHPILFGIVVPVVPLFLTHAWDTPLPTNHLTVRFDVGGTILASRPVRVRFDEIRLRTTAGGLAEGPLRITGLTKHDFSECPSREVDLPGGGFQSTTLKRLSLFELPFKHERFYLFRLEYQPAIAPLDSLEFTLGGVTVGEHDVEPVRIVFSRRRDWQWFLFGLT